MWTCTQCGALRDDTFNQGLSKMIKSYTIITYCANNGDASWREFPKQLGFFVLWVDYVNICKISFENSEKVKQHEWA